jgi:hypothetical protein
VLASLRADPDRPAFEIGPRTVSRGDLLAMVRRLAGTLHFRVGIRVAAGPCSAREPSTVDAAMDADAAAKADAAGNADVAAGSAHQHGVDPVSAALLAVDGVVALAVVVLLRRPPPQPSRPPS